MVPQTTCKLVRWAGAVTLGLLASVVIAPTRAEAGCGDYVMMGGHHSAGHSHSADPQDHAPGTPRCHAPLCSDNAMPPAAPAPKIEVRVERWAVATAARLEVLPSHQSLLAIHDDVPCEGHGLSILRPPR